MAATGTPTPNLGLRIPQGTDPASVDDINYNSNLLDTKLGAVGETSVQDQIDSLNSKITTRTISVQAYSNRVTWETESDPAMIRKTGNVCMLSGFITYQVTPTSAQTSVIALPSDCIPATNAYGVCTRNSDRKMFMTQISSAGNFNIFNDGQISSGDRVYIGFTYVV